LANIFGYGTLKAETAGHHSKFVFPFAPNPTYYAQKVLEAREKEQIENRNYSYPQSLQNPSPPPQPPPGQPQPPAYS
jgi:hypothetical protein